MYRRQRRSLFDSSMTISAGIFRQYDVRGVVGNDLTAEAAYAIGSCARHSCAD